MYSIITELASETAGAVAQIRSAALAGCGPDPAPLQWPLHLSWQGAESYYLDEVELRMRTIARTFAPVTTRIDGVGVFTGAEPVVYLSVTRTPALSVLNATLWEALSPLARSANRYFSPEEWVPHISILYGKAEMKEAIACLVGNLSTVALRIEIKLDHIYLGYFHGDNHGGLYRLPLLGSER